MTVFRNPTTTRKRKRHAAREASEVCRYSNGESALLYLTDRRKAVYVPTALGYSLVVSPDDPEAFLSALRHMARR